jgi:predicted  nucleic acid-binding Zn-ribbon protein
MNRMVASVLDDDMATVSKRLDELEKEVGVLKGKAASLEEQNAELKNENQGLKEEVKVLTDWWSAFDKWGKQIHARVERFVRNATEAPEDGKEREA